MSIAEPSQRIEDAAAWCARVAEGLETFEDQLAFEAWLAAEPDNRPTFERMAALWSGTSEIGDAPELIAVRTDALEAFRVANRRRWSRGIMARWRPIAAIAACLLALIVGSLHLLQLRPAVYATAIGEHRVVKLADGSRLSLDADTRIEVAYSDERRSLRLLAGRAKFDVAKDPRRPFTVTAGDRVVVATGTAFSVEMVAREMRVILYEGSISVLENSPSNEPPRHILLKTRAAADQLLKPGTALVASLDAPVATVDRIDAARSLSWEGNQLSFSDEPLGIAAERMNRYSDVKLKVVGSAAAMPVSGLFNSGDTEGFVEGVRALYPLKVDRTGDRITLAADAP
jgi:transmembrane sensor